MQGLPGRHWPQGRSPASSSALPLFFPACLNVPLKACKPGILSLSPGETFCRFGVPNVHPWSQGLHGPSASSAGPVGKALASGGPHPPLRSHHFFLLACLNVPLKACNPGILSPSPAGLLAALVCPPHTLGWEPGYPRPLRVQRRACWEGTAFQGKKAASSSASPLFSPGLPQRLPESLQAWCPVLTPECYSRFQVPHLGETCTVGWKPGTPRPPQIWRRACRKGTGLQDPSLLFGLAAFFPQTASMTS